MAVISYVGECFRASGRWSCHFLWYSILFSLLYRPAPATFDYKPKHVFAAELLQYMVGGWLGRWVVVSCGTWVVFCRRTGSGCHVGAVVLGVAFLLLAAERCCMVGFFLLLQESSKLR